MENEKQALIDELKNLLEQNVTDIKERVEQIKSQFYRVYHQELETAKKAAEAEAEASGEPLADWMPQIDAAEQQMRELLTIYKQKRQEMMQKLEKEMADNLQRKENILAQMKDMVENTDGEVMANIQKMRDLQAEWKTIGPVPQPQAQDIWKLYQQRQEQFYDLVKINIELRDLDFKRNLEMKTALCERAEKLQEEESIIEASRSLQQLHDEWAEIGPVARELREELWNRFKAASTIINKKHQAYFDALHQKEQENYEKKLALIEQLKQIDCTTLKTTRQWEEAQETLQRIQDEWRTIGFAPKKFNQTVYDTYREECNRFFKAKTAFFKQMRDQLSDNLKAKRQLLEKVQAILEMEDWQNHTSEVVEAQKTWKTIGQVPRKYSDEIWALFTQACDTFFNRKREAYKTEREEQNKARMERSIANGNRNSLMRIYDNLTQEIKTAENNILFFSAKSKGANKLVEDMQKKIEALKMQRKEIEEKIEAQED